MADDEWWKADKEAPTANWWDQDKVATSTPPQSSGSLTDLALAPGVSALQLAGGAPGLPTDVFGLLGQGLNWLTGREWRPGMDPAQSGMTQADWLRAAQKPVAAPQFAPIGISQPLEIAGRFLAGQGGLGLPLIVGQEPATEGERIGRKAGQLVFGGGPAGAVAGLTATATSEIGRALDKAGVTGGYGEPVGLLAGPLVHEGVKTVGRGLIPKADPTVAAQAKSLMDRGVRVSPSQISEGQTLGYVRSGADATSLVPSSFSRQQGEEFTRAVSKTFGENTARITQDVIDGAQTRIGGELQKLYRSGSIDANASPTLVNSLANIERQAQSSLQPQQMGYVSKALDEVVNSVSNGPLRGDDFWNMIKYDAKSALNNAMRSADPTVKGYAVDIKKAMMRALEESAPPSLRSDLAKFNREYTNLQTVRDLALRGGGKVSPQALLGRVVSEQSGVRGELGELAEAGKSILSPLPNSGTAQRAVGASFATGIPFTVGGPVAAAVGLTAPPVVRGLLDSQTLARAMINKALPQSNPGLLGALGGAGQAYARAAPGTVGLLGRQYVSPQYFHTGLLAP